MKISPQKFRETILLLLFSKDFYESDAAELFSLVSGELKIAKSVVEKAHQKKEEIVKHLDEIDAIISKQSTNFEFNRIQHVERNILRLATYELLYEKLLDTPVVIAEAKRLAKKFSTPEASLFCQAIVDAIAKGNHVRNISNE